MASERCKVEGCRKKLTPADIVMGTCKCQGKYCNMHRLPEAHMCPCLHDVQANATKSLPKVVRDKLETRI